MNVWVIPRFCEPVRERKAEFFLIGGGGELAPLVQDFWLLLADNKRLGDCYVSAHVQSF
jgi:hypothetical protein